jgi:NADPH-dependent 2,4-dienoyl-CoA reductase/sulfur reductase-like enzyme
MGDRSGVVVVGASIAGVRAAERLRGVGFAGRITLLSGEAHLPYDRPPLSKAVLVGGVTPDRLTLPAAKRLTELDIDLRTSTTATSLQVDTRTITLSDGSLLPYDDIVIATGAVARTLSGTERLHGIYVLRSLDDASTLALALARASSVVVVGAGFIGAEVASAAARLGAAVTVLEAADSPLARVLGPEVGEALGRLHAEHGVTLRCGVEVVGFEADATQRVTAVLLGNGDRLVADAVVIGIGARPATHWLASSGLPTADGVECDRYCRAAPGVWAAGDVARWKHPELGLVRAEHWTNAREQAGLVAANICSPDALTAYEPVAYVWSDQYGHRLQVVGDPHPSDDVRLLTGTMGRAGFVAVYVRDGDVTAAVGLDAGPGVIGLRPHVARKARLREVLEQSG